MRNQKDGASLVLDAVKGVFPDMLNADPLELASNIPTYLKRHVSMLPELLSRRLINVFLNTLSATGMFFVSTPKSDSSEAIVHIIMIRHDGMIECMRLFGPIQKSWFDGQMAIEGDRAKIKRKIKSGRKA